MPFLLLLLAFVLVPVAEISVLIRVGGAIGPLNTILFVIFTAILGAYLVRQQGFATLQKLKQETDAGRMPAMQIAEGVALLFAGAVLLTPGFITDAFGFALLVPPIRQAVIKFFASRVTVQSAQTGFYSTHTGHTPTRSEGSVIEGEVVDRHQP